MPLQLREYQKNDFIALKNIIRKTWRYDEFSSPKTASRLADVFLSSCLTNYTFSRVAVLNGKPVGIILVKDIARHTCPLPNRFQQLRAVLSLYLTKEGRAVSKIFESVTGIDRELLRESGKNYPAELALFVVSPSCRGQGVGKAYYNSIELAYQNGCKSIAFPGISTGVYGYPLDEAARVSLLAAVHWLDAHKDTVMNIYFCCFKDAELSAYRKLTQ